MIPVKMIVHSQNGKLLTWFHLNYSHAQFSESRKGENFWNHHLVTPKFALYDGYFVYCGYCQFKFRGQSKKKITNNRI